MRRSPESPVPSRETAWRAAMVAQGLSKENQKIYLEEKVALREQVMVPEILSVSSY